MNYRVAFFVCLALMLGSLLLNLPGRMQAQEAGAPKPVAGRYMVTSSQITAGSVRVVVCDTATGQCWTHTDSKKWLDFGSPIPK